MPRELSQGHRGRDPRLIACLDIHTGYAIQERALGVPRDRKTIAGIERVKLRISERIAAEMPAAEVYALMGKLVSLRQ